MAKFKIYKLHFTAPLHLGDNRDDYGVSLKTIQSDTLYASVISSLAKLGKTIPADGDLGCSISSLFPFYQKSKDAPPVYFFPKPLIQKAPTLDNVAIAKKIKGVSWLDKDYFEMVLNGTGLFVKDEDIAAIQDKYLSKQKIDQDFIESQVSPRVTISRTGDEDAVPFYMDRINFKDQSGLFFIADGNTDLLDVGLHLLQYEGIGTDRNIGNGSFTLAPQETIEIRLPESAKSSISLSMFIPENKEQLTSMIKGESVAYDFTRRGGWITTPLHNTIRKNTIHAFLPASVFNMQIEEPVIKGSIVDLAPQLDFSPKIDHPIWRNGKSIFLPIKD